MVALAQVIDMSHVADVTAPAYSRGMRGTTTYPVDVSASAPPMEGWEVVHFIFVVYNIIIIM